MSRVYGVLLGFLHTVLQGLRLAKGIAPVLGDLWDWAYFHRPRDDGTLLLKDPCCCVVEELPSCVCFLLRCGIEVVGSREFKACCRKGRQ